MNAELVSAALPQFCPTTNHYYCSDGRWVLVTVPTVGAESLTPFGVVVPILKTHIPTRVDVFLSDELQTVLDADGDPANGMTPLASFNDVDSHEAALAALGYEVVEHVS